MEDVKKKPGFKERLCKKFKKFKAKFTVSGQVKEKAKAKLELVKEKAKAVGEGLKKKIAERRKFGKRYVYMIDTPFESCIVSGEVGFSKHGMICIGSALKYQFNAESGKWLGESIGDIVMPITSVSLITDKAPSSFV